MFGFSKLYHFSLKSKKCLAFQLSGLCKLGRKKKKKASYEPECFCMYGLCIPAAEQWTGFAGTAISE